MADTPKIKIKAGPLVSDIRSGMKESEFKKKYGLCHKSLDRVLGKLTAAGLLTESEVRAWKGIGTAEDSICRLPLESALWHCPSCNAPQAEEKDECPVCGVIVRKLSARREHEVNPSEGLSNDSSPRKKWHAVMFSLIVFTGLGIGLIWWAKHRVSDQRHFAETTPVSSDVAVTHHQPPSEEPDSGILPPEDSQALDTALAPQEFSEPPFYNSGSGTQWDSANPDRNAPQPSRNYGTGVLRQFSSKDFKEEVVEASRTYPVVVQFYSNT